MVQRIHGNRYTFVASTALFLAALMLFAPAPGCDRETTVGPRHNPKPVAALVSRSDCKRSTELAASGTAAIRDCFEYELAGGDTLLLRHINAAFNCCPGDITADISFVNDTITIVEHESESGCHCLCLYDLEYRFFNIEAGTYTIRFFEPYTTDADEPLRSTVDLSAAPSGSFCVDRNGYPWDTGGGSTEPYGLLVSRTDCHSHSSTAAGYAEAPYDVPGDMSCADWQYSGGVLRLKHINAAFNCCPGDMAADISIANDTITIVEREEQSMCDCSCLYDLEFEIRNLEPRAYAIRIVEPYVQPGDERLEFTADLAALPAGVFCAYRPHYPWMYQGTMEEDRAKLEAMRKAIINLMGPPSCGDEGECRSIGLGAKPCGGVWEYLVYSTATVDVGALRYLICRYNAFNEGFNRRYSIYSDCMFVMPPTVGCVEGVCAALDDAP